MSTSQGSEATYTVVVATKVEPDTREALRLLARSNHRSASAEVRLALLRHLDAEGLAKKEAA
jgi:plasmid stability protein